jgi:hypothetical protein
MMSVEKILQMILDALKSVTSITESVKPDPNLIEERVEKQDIKNQVRLARAKLKIEKLTNRLNRRARKNNKTDN